jgi:outer membrane protein TolC
VWAFLFSLCVISSTSEWESLTPEQALEKLPGKALSLEFVLKTAAENADVFDRLRAQAERTNVPAWQGRSGLDPQIFAGFVYEDDQSEPPSPFAPETRETLGGVVGLRTHVLTGTQLQTQIRHERNALEFLSTPKDKYYLSRVDLSVSQSLLRDSFGVGTRALVRSGDAASQALGFGLQQQAEALLLRFVRLYYDAWLAQTRVLSARDSLARRKRLKNTVEVRVRRGNAVKSEGLQIDSAVLASEVEVMNAEKSLRDTWRALVIGLKLPFSFLKVDPVQVPVKLDDSISLALQLCTKLDEREVIEGSVEVLAAKAAAESAEQKARFSRSAKLWDLRAKASLGAQNREAAWGNSLKDSGGFKNPVWSVGLELQVPFLSLRERAEVQQSLSDSLSAQADSRLAQSSVQVRWANTCEAVRLAKEEIRALQSAVSKQKEREGFERQRYQIGNTTVFSVVSAGDDLSGAESHLRNVEAMGRVAAWETLALSGQLLKKFEEQMGPLSSRSPR